MMEMSREMRENIVKMINEQYKDSDYRKERYDLIPDPDKTTPKDDKDDFCSAKSLGKGAFGNVYEVRDKESGEVLALKRLLIKYEFNYTNPSVTHSSKSDRDRILSFVQYCQEGVLQSDTFSHPNIVKVKDTWIQYHSNENTQKDFAEANYIIDIVAALQSEGDFRLTPELRAALNNIRGLCVYMTMEKYDQSLTKWIDSSSQPQEDREDVIRQLIAALHYIHSKGYSHCDLRGDNILMRKRHADKQTVEVAIADFGLSELHNPDSGLSNKQVEDVYDFGLIVYDILGKSPSEELKHKSKEEIAELVRQNIGDLPMANIVNECLDPDEDARVTAKQLYQQWFPTP